MGLDISIGFINNDAFYSNYLSSGLEDTKMHNLSRTFCNFMCRSNVINGEPELNQIGRITGIDIAPIYAMETYGSETGEELEFMLEVAESEEERQQILKQARQNKEALAGNIDIVLITVNTLITQLSNLPNLHAMLNNHGWDTLGYKDYFTDFTTDKGDGYINNNFGQDLRNFSSFLQYAKGQGETTVYFRYG